jgi:hypothetical protein
MSETICNPCPDFTCVCPVPECTETLILGNISDVNTAVLVYILKEINGASYVQSVVSDANGRVTLDMTDPNAAYFNHFDGNYQVWVTKAGYWCDDARLEIVQAGVTSTTYQITFSRSLGAPIGTTIELIPTT